METTNMMLSVSPAEAVRRGLPPLRVSLDTQGFVSSSFPTSHTIAHLAGPPGGVLFFSMRWVNDILDGAQAIARHLKREPDLVGHDATFGIADELVVAGERRLALVYYTGQGHPLTATAGCAIAIPLPLDGRPGPRSTLLILLGAAGTPRSVTDPDEIAQRPALAQVLASVALVYDPEGSSDLEEPLPSDDSEETSSDIGAGMPLELARPQTGRHGEHSAETVRIQTPLEHALDELGGLKLLLGAEGWWHETPPTSEAYKTWDLLARQMWSIQSILTAMVASLERLRAEHHRRAPDAGVAARFTELAALLGDDPRAEHVAERLVRIAAILSLD